VSRRDFNLAESVVFSHRSPFPSAAQFLSRSWSHLCLPEPGKLCGTAHIVRRCDTSPRRGRLLYEPTPALEPLPISASGQGWKKRRFVRVCHLIRVILSSAPVYLDPCHVGLDPLEVSGVSNAGLTISYLLFIATAATRFRTLGLVLQTRCGTSLRVSTGGVNGPTVGKPGDYTTSLTA